MKTEAVKSNSSSAASQQLTVLPDQKISFGQSAILGLQHVLAMDVYVVPFLVAMLIGLQADQSGALIQSTFIAAGLATIVQSYFCMKLPIAQGPSYVPLGAIVGIYAASAYICTIFAGLADPGCCTGGNFVEQVPAGYKNCITEGIKMEYL
ncbi:solute carrier family 23 protein [Paenibacillus sanguinis]|uniref:solute carrier family 23 protein n=1 Tax=Paenibacillus sanguinis TaxID=225906 RepID=UPI000374F4A2|nr:solute carrier family 23 protein [Paenibacillus sanguinis]